MTLIVIFSFSHTHPHTVVALLGSPIIMDPHKSEQHTDSIWLQQEPDYFSDNSGKVVGAETVLGFEMIDTGPN